MGRGNEHRSRQRQSGAEPVDPWGDYAPQQSYERPARPQASSGREAEARVKWFNPDKGFGFVELTDGSGEAFLHIRQVEAAGHSTLPSGTTLVIQVGPGQKGSQVTTPDTMGTVKWYDEVKGFGFIAVEGECKDLFVHVSALERVGLTQLEQGQAVRVAIVEGRKGREVGTIELT